MNEKKCSIESCPSRAMDGRTKCGPHLAANARRQQRYQAKYPNVPWKSHRKRGSASMSSDGWCDECQAYGFHRMHVTAEGADCPALDAAA